MQKTLITIALSVACSVATTVALQRHAPDPKGVLRASRIELVDRAGNVRLEMEMRSFGEGYAGRETPVIEMKDENSRTAIVMQLDPRGAGSLIFNSNESAHFREGAVVLGEIQGGDTVDATDSFGGWGLQVTDNHGHAALFGLHKDGRPLDSPLVPDPPAR